MASNIQGFGFEANHGPKIFRHGESAAANPANAREIDQSCGIYPQPGRGAATSTLLTGIGALGCIAAHRSWGLSSQATPGSAWTQDAAKAIARIAHASGGRGNRQCWTSFSSW